MAELHAEKQKRVAELDADAATFEKAANIARGEGEAQRKRAVLAADGALDQKLTAWVNAQKYWADAYSTRKVPQMYLAGSGGKSPDQSTLNMNTMMSVWLANQIGLDLTMKKGAKATQ